MPRQSVMDELRSRAARCPHHTLCPYTLSDSPLSPCSFGDFQTLADTHRPSSSRSESGS